MRAVVDHICVPPFSLSTNRYPGVASSRGEPRVIMVDPLQNARWDSLVSEHPGSSFFHVSDWARVLHETYGHQPVYFCQFSNGQLSALLPVMEVSSRWRGRRGVSLPFTDLCNPLVSGESGAAPLYSSVMEYGCRNGWRTFESRSTVQERPNAEKWVTYWGHTLNLGDGPDQLFARLKSSVRCGVRKAERAGLRVEFSNGVTSMRTFYRLHCLTRRRLGIPCQPAEFFDNIARFMLAKGHGFMATAWCGESPAASVLILQQGAEAFYKFGASDYRFQSFRPNNLVMWEAIKKCSLNGLARLHFGRTSLHHEGLRRFKLGFGAREERIDCYKYDYSKEAFVTGVDRSESFARYLLRLLPVPMLRLVGALIYPDLA